MDKNKILQSIRRFSRQNVPLPNPDVFDSEDDALLVNFKNSILQVGGGCILIAKDKVISYLNENYSHAVDFRTAEVKKEYSANCSIEKLAQLKAVILEGQIGVAENGAIYVDEENFPNRLIPFINEEIIICLNSENVLGNMHNAYSQIENHLNSFGLFISGPSKTADIEQNLVFGAHGSKSFFVILYNNVNQDFNNLQ